MAQLISQILHPEFSGSNCARADRQRFRRVKLALKGRYMRENRYEYPCETLDVSPGSIAVRSYEPVFKGERIVFYIDQLGRFEGHISRVFEGGFAVDISSNRRKREKFAEILTWVLNKDTLGLADDRRHDRMAPQYTYGEFTMPNGRVVRVTVLDLSQSGASIAMSNKVPVGAEVALGGIPARVVRHHPKGIGIEFYKVQNSAALKGYFF